MNATTRPLMTHFLKRFFPGLFGPADETDRQAKPAPAKVDLQFAGHDLKALQNLRQEAQRLRQLRNAELDKAEKAALKLKHFESERISTLTQARLSGDTKLEDEAAKILETINRLERDRKDAAGIAEQIAAKLDALKPKIEAQERSSLMHLGKFLEDRMRALVDHYHQLAPELAETVVQIRAVQILMIEHFKTGNSNGFQGEIVIPDFQAFDHRSRPNLLDGSQKSLGEAARDRAAAIHEELRKAGHHYGSKHN